jgi:hypothetical protein
MVLNASKPAVAGFERLTPRQVEKLKSDSLRPQAL